jgi:hypothetical protein
VAELQAGELGPVHARVGEQTLAQRGPGRFRRRGHDTMVPDRPSAVMVHLPTHASWLNQVEIYFSVVQRKLLTPDDFEDLDVLADRLLAFEARYNATAEPFDWRFNQTDLRRLLNRLAA